MAVGTYEASGCFCAIGLAVVGGWLGWLSFGVVGAVAGVPLGYVVGWSAGWFLVEANFQLSIWIEIRTRRRALRSTFGEYWRPDRQADWDRTVAQLQSGESVSGRVVAQFYYGVVLDVGNGFPALLPKLRFAEPFSENPSISAEVVARIDEIRPASREIHLTQGRTYAETRQSLQTET